jgi:enoyl-[acyl-carrier protein] reductase II
MAWVGTAELVVAVSEAGGLGMLSPLTERGLKKELDIVRERTEKPFGLNIPLNSPISEQIVNLAVKEKIQVIATSAGDPSKFAPLLKKSGAVTMHVVASVKHAVKAEEAGVDAIVAEGAEKGGHLGHDEIGTFVLVPQVVDSVRIPVVAAGGIVDGRGLAAALALGASGIQLGTRFLMTKECIAHENCKRAILEAKDDSTTVIMRGFLPSRVLKNKFAISQKAEKGALIKEGMKARDGLLKGDIKDGAIWCGQAAGMIHDIPSVEELIKRIVDDAEKILHL